jgi:protein-S-isoprenylcysteine O-methyltransferase Ste14
MIVGWVARAIAGSFAFLLIAPGVVAGLVPWLLTGWATDAWWPPLRVLGGFLIGVGLAVLLEAFVRFAVEGVGTPAPVAPTERLVVGGAYRYVRNPMYLAVVALIVGQALLLEQPTLFAYVAVFGIAVAAFAYGYEEPVLARRFGAQYEDYRHAVPAWWPRLTPWDPDREMKRRALPRAREGGTTASSSRSRRLGDRRRASIAAAAAWVADARRRNRTTSAVLVRGAELDGPPLAVRHLDGGPSGPHVTSCRAPASPPARPRAPDHGTAPRTSARQPGAPARFSIARPHRSRCRSTPR